MMALLVVAFSGRSAPNVTPPAGANAIGGVPAPLAHVADELGLQFEPATATSAGSAPSRFFVAEVPDAAVVAVMQRLRAVHGVSDVFIKPEASLP
jgi:hypothetical protein